MPKAKGSEKKADAKEAAKKKGRRYLPWEREKIMTKFAKLREKGVPAVEAGKKVGVPAVEAGKKVGVPAVEAGKKVGVPYVTLQAWAKKDGKPLPGSRKTKPTEKGRGPGRPPKAVGRKPGQPKGKVGAKPRGRPRGRPRATAPRPAAPAGGLVPTRLLEGMVQPRSPLVVPF
jgi:hypothetical protein